MSPLEADRCTCEGKTGKRRLVFACSGASNVGQLANDAAIELATQGWGTFLCIAGIGGRISGILETARTADEIIAIGGCPACCVKSTLDLAGIPVHRHVVATDLGIEKNHDFTLDPGDVRRLVLAVDPDRP